jgi:hypothetical protein
MYKLYGTAGLVASAATVPLYFYVRTGIHLDSYDYKIPILVVTTVFFLAAALSLSGMVLFGVGRRFFFLAAGASVLAAVYTALVVAQLVGIHDLGSPALHFRLRSFERSGYSILVCAAFGAHVLFALCSLEILRESRIHGWLIPVMNLLVGTAYFIGLSMTNTFQRFGYFPLSFRYFKAVSLFSVPFLFAVSFGALAVFLFTRDTRGAEGEGAS